MDTPLADFVRRYAESGAARLHMPGHKGRARLGPEALDLTEIPGADALYHGDGVIAQSERNAQKLFGSAKTLYSAEGSSLCIRAMLHLALLYAKSCGKAPKIVAGRNAHRVFLSAAALLGLDICWLYGEQDAGLLSCSVSPAALEAVLEAEKPAAVYLTSPDYLGFCAELPPLAAVCRRHGALLLVDNAHGAYLKFLSPSRHPLDLGADLCCDSAHKTLPVLTGGAYLHLSRSCPEDLLPMAERAMQLFASTSPSYLILQSLDLANRALAGDYPARLRETAARLDALKARLRVAGWTLCGDEPLKLTLRPKARGYTGEALAEALAEKQLICEFADPDFCVLMLAPDNAEEDYARLEASLAALPPRAPISDPPPAAPRPVVRLTPREALLSPFETLPAEACLGRTLASPCVSCPPAVSILACGEGIDAQALAAFRYYGITRLAVVREPR